MIIAPRITADPDVLGGKPCIRGLRFPVRDLLELLANGVPPDELLRDYPYLEREDVPAALAYAASQLGHPVVIAAE
jgi:uncharacterized protein (DUF433 family)